MLPLDVELSAPGVTGRGIALDEDLVAVDGAAMCCDLLTRPPDPVELLYLSKRVIERR